MKTSSAKQKMKMIGKKYGFRSGLEEKVGEQLNKLYGSVKYETEKIKYTINEIRTYTPDFKLPNGIIIETKGRFTPDDRKKHLLIKEQYPGLDIRFVFSNSNNKIRKGSKTSYADWCTKNGYLYADKLIPEEWLKE